MQKQPDYHQLKKENAEVAEAKNSEELYRTLFDKTDYGFHLIKPITDDSGKVIDYITLKVNAAYERHSGLRKEQTIGKKISEVIPDMEPLWLSIVQQVFETGVSHHVEDFNTSTNRWYEQYIFKYKEGQVGALFKDVTERKKAEEALKETEERLRLITENSRDGINLLDLKTGKYIYMNPAQVALTGFTPQEINGISAQEAYERTYPDDRKITVEQQKKIAAGKDNPQPVEYRWKVKSGEYRWFSDSRTLVRDNKGQAIALVGISRDITERKKAEEALKESEKLLKIITENTIDPIYIKDRQSRMVTANPACERATGKRFAEMKGKNDLEIYSDPKIGQAILQTDKRIMDSGKTEVVEEVIDTPNGQRIFLSTKTPWQNNNGEVVGIIGISRDITERKKAEEALRLSEEKFSKAFQNSTNAITITRLSDGKIIEGNESSYQLFGWSYDEVLGKTTLELNMWADPNDRIKVSKELSTKGIVKDLEVSLQKKDGTTFPVVLNASLIDVNDEKCLLCSFLDMSERKKIEAQLKLSEEKYRHIVKIAPVGIYEIDFTTSKILSVNDVFCEYSGYSEQEWLSGQVKPQDLLDEPSNRLFANRIRSVLAGEKVDENVEFRGKTRDGREFWTELSVKFMMKDAKPHGLVVAHDITDRKKAEEALHESEKQKAFLLRLSDTLRPLRDPVAIQKATSLLTSEYLDIGRTTYCEIRYEPDIMVYLTHDWTRHGMPSLAGGRFRADDFGPFINKMMSTGRTATVADAESDPNLSSGERDNWRAINVVSNCSIPVLKEGKFVAYLAAQDNRPHYWTASEIKLLEYVADISWMAVERANAEAALHQNEAKLQEYSTSLERLVEERTKQLKASERLAAIGATAGMVGHDIRNPLQAITGDVYLLRDYLSGMPESISVKHDVAESLESIEQNVSYINKIVADLQDYSRAVTPKYVETNLYDLVLRCFRPIVIPDNVFPKIDVDQSLMLKTDTDLFQRILTNLVINAIQAMPKGGKLSIVSTKNQDSVVLSVQDTGVGIPEHVKPKLFTPMMTTKSKGQGLGLAVVKRLTEAMKGTITFESEEGKGTKFIIELPIN